MPGWLQGGCNLTHSADVILTRPDAMIGRIWLTLTSYFLISAGQVQPGLGVPFTIYYCHFAKRPLQ